MAATSTATVTGKHRQPSPWQRYSGWTLRGLLIAVCLAAACLTILPAALGFQRYTVTGTSMNGTIGAGSVVYDRVVPTSSLAVGDVITYQPPAGSSAAGSEVTRRIAAMTAGPDGRTIYRTKGDNSAVDDPWTFYLAGAEQAKVAMHIPYVGYALSVLTHRVVRVAVIGVIAMLIALRLCIGLWRDAGAEQRARRRAIRSAHRAGALTALDASDSTLSSHADDDAEVDADLGAIRAAALAALIAASSAAASSRGLNHIHEVEAGDIAGNGTRRRAS